MTRDPSFRAAVRALRAHALAIALCACPSPGSAQATSAPPAALAGHWKGLAEWAGAREWVALSITPADSGRLAVSLSLPAIHAYDFPLGVARWSGDTLRAGPFELRWDEAGDRLEGMLPAMLVPVHSIPVTLKRVPALAPEPRGGSTAPTREPVWSFSAGAALWAPLEAGAGLVYVGGDDGVLHALSVNSGRERWRFKAGGALRARPKLVASSVYVHADDGFLYRLDSASGRVRWKQRLERDSIVRIPIDQPGSRHDFTASGVLAWGGALYVGTHDGRLLALEPEAGRTIWTADVGGAVIATPALAGGRVFVGSLDGHVTAWDAGVGERLWSFDTGAAVSAAPVSDGRLVLASSRSYDLFALDAITGESRWNRYVWFSWVESTPALVDGVAYVGSSDAARVFALELASGRSLWEADVRGISWTTPAVTLDRVYVAVRHSPSISPHEGSLLALDRATGAELWRVTNDAPAGATHRGFASSPVVSRGRVIVAGLDGIVRAFPEDDAEADAIRRRAAGTRHPRPSSR